MVPRKSLSLILLFLVIPLLAVQAQQKYALVIGNGAYTGITRLSNPVNDAADVSAALRGLGFTVDQVTNAGRVQMEEAVTRLKNRLNAARGSYGFFFYAGHGVQSAGENYLIPVDASIPSEAYLGDRSVSMQAVLEELNAAGNALNIVVLDACRDNPFGWRRSGGSRGLQVVSNQPADSIIVYATSAGSTAADGTGRNGLFTTHLLNNLKNSGLTVQEIFNRTGADVRRASGGAQIPAIYLQFFDVAYLGTRPAAVVPTPQPSPSPAPQPRPAPVTPAVVPPSPMSEQDRQEAIRYNDSGRAYYEEGDKDRAIADFNQAIRLDPNLALAYSNRGEAYRTKGDKDRAIADFNQAIRLDPNLASAYKARGRMYLYSFDDYDRAIADFNQAIRLNPNDSFAYSDRAFVYYYGKHDYDRAIADYNQAIRLESNPSSSLYYLRGDAYRSKGDNDRAIADFNQAIRLNPNNAGAYNDRGRAYWNKGDKTQARADWNKALQIDPNNLSAKLYLARYH